jgi:hypothetical protein
MAKAPQANEAENSTPEGGEALVASELDERTHAEMLMLYHESATATRFAKHQQWATVGGTLLLFVLLGIVGHRADKEGFLFNMAVICSIVLSIGTIYSLFIFQSWQGSEREKMSLISSRFSNLSRAVRGVSPPRETSAHRYIMLSFMILLTILANWLLLVYLAPK